MFCTARLRSLQGRGYTSLLPRTTPEERKPARTMNLQRYSPVLVFLVIAPPNTRNLRYRRGLSICLPPILIITSARGLLKVAPRPV